MLTDMVLLRMESAAVITRTTRSQVNELDALDHHDRSAQILAEGFKALNNLKAGIVSFRLMSPYSFIKSRCLLYDSQRTR
jgi:hypothetical protein